MNAVRKSEIIFNKIHELTDHKSEENVVRLVKNLPDLMHHQTPTLNKDQIRLVNFRKILTAVRKSEIIFNKIHELTDRKSEENGGRLVQN
ncbi:hypothetical protein QE152_g5634 [Popillia japonica]|uniref:Uncharacterized protein n=1 Tax=Popillia japonica TaxID=7064 RepID=A0AAW1MK32_POPJA